MASEKPGAETAEAARQRRRTPPPTIELTATDVTPDPVPDAQEPQDDPPPAPQPTEQPGADPGGTTRGAAARPFDLSWPHLGAAAAGAAIVLVMFGVLWSSGLIGIAARDGDTDALASRLAPIERQLRELATRPPPAPTESNVSDTKSSDARSLDDLAARLARAEAALAAPRSGPPAAVDQALTGRVGTLEAALKAMSDNIAGLNGRAEEMSGALRDLRERNEAAAKALAEMAQERLAARIATLERADKTMQDEFARKSDAPSDRATRLAITASALKSAVERGESFTAELAAVRRLAADPALLEPLAPFAASGVPSAAALARELSALVPELRRAVDGGPREGGLLDRLQANAERLVRVRPVGEVAGDDPAAVIARVDADAARANIPGALAELQKLPPAVRAPAEGWIGKAQARAPAIDAAQKFAAAALAVLGKPAPSDTAPQ